MEEYKVPTNEQGLGAFGMHAEIAQHLRHRAFGHDAKIHAKCMSAGLNCAAHLMGFPGSDQLFFRYSLVLTCSARLRRFNWEPADQLRLKIIGKKTKMPHLAPLLLPRANKVAHFIVATQSLTGNYRTLM